MSAANATPNPIYDQAYRFPGKIISSVNGNPITGGLTSLASQISKDGATFVSTTNPPSEIGTSGYFVLDLTAAEMSFSSVIVRVTATNPDAVEFSIYIPICNLTPTAGRPDAQAVQRVEQFILDTFYYLYNSQTISATLQTVALPSGATLVSGSVSNDGNGGSVRSELA